jgi:hypothetical protein
MSTINHTKEGGTISQYILVRAALPFSDFSDVPPPFRIEADPPKKGGIGAVTLEDEGEGDEDMGETPHKRLKRKAQMQERNLEKGKVARK